MTNTELDHPDDGTKDGGDWMFGDFPNHEHQGSTQGCERAAPTVASSHNACRGCKYPIQSGFYCGYCLQALR